MQTTGVGFNLAMPTTIDQFKLAVNAICGVGNHERDGEMRESVYILFEDEISDKLRAEIYGLALHLKSPEPLRASMHVMGFTWW